MKLYAVNLNTLAVSLVGPDEDAESFTDPVFASAQDLLDIKGLTKDALTAIYNRYSDKKVKQFKTRPDGAVRAYDAVEAWFASEKAEKAPQRASKGVLTQFNAALLGGSSWPSLRG